jgi:hypothetical protein
MKRTNRKLEVRSRTTELNQDYLEARATCGLNQSLDMGRRDPTHVAAVLHRNENPAVAGGFFISQLGPIDIHSLQIIAAARWMKPVKWEDRLS